MSISEGGIYIRKKNPYCVGTELNVRVPLKDRVTLNLKGRVVYVKGIGGNVFKIDPGMAVAFSDVSRHDSETLNSYITDSLTKDIFEEQAAYTPEWCDTYMQEVLAGIFTEHYPDVQVIEASAAEQPKWLATQDSAQEEYLAQLAAAGVDGQSIFDEAARLYAQYAEKE